MKKSTMNLQEARELGGRVAKLVHSGETEGAMALLSPILTQRVKFPLLGEMGKKIGEGPLETTNAFLPHIAATEAEGGWPIIGMALNAQLGRDLAGAMARSRGFIIEGDVWYCADILGERVPGPGLLTNFEPVFNILKTWRGDENRWVRRTVGIATHYWAKRAKGNPKMIDQVKQMLNLLAPMFTEWEIDVVKGVGWGFKTIGQYYPELLTDFLATDIVPAERKHRAIMLRKALKFLTPEQRARATGGLDS
jgi:3-methyladenine DNA glycosylase AlkD